MGKKLLEILRDKIRFKHYSYRIEQVYLEWAKRYILFHNKKHPKLANSSFGLHSKKFPEKICEK